MFSSSSSKLIATSVEIEVGLVGSSLISIWKLSLAPPTLDKSLEEVREFVEGDGAVVVGECVFV